MNPKIAEILKVQAELMAEASRQAAAGAAHEQAERERERAAKVQTCLSFLPEYLREWASVEDMGEYEATLTIQIPGVDNDDVGFAPFQARIESLHYQPKLAGYRLPRITQADENEKPDYYFISKTYGLDFSLKDVEAVIYGAHRLGVDYQRAMFTWMDGELSRLAADEARQAKAEATRRAENTEKEKLVAFAELLNVDPVLKPLFEVLAAVASERGNYRERLDSLAWEMDESESRASRRLAEARRDAQRLADEARAAQSEASDAEERARKAEKKLKEVN